MLQIPQLILIALIVVGLCIVFISHEERVEKRN
jgi:hypothetical protein